MLGFSWFKEWVNRRKSYDRETQMREKLGELSALRDKLFNELRELSDREEQLLREGRVAPGKISKQRAAAFIADVRQQSQILNGRIHAYSRMVRVIQAFLANADIVGHRSDLMGLPNADELSSIAVDAETVLEELDSQTDTANVIGIPSLAVSDEEANILAELEGNLPENKDVHEKETKVEKGEAYLEELKKFPVPHREQA